MDRARPPPSPMTRLIIDQPFGPLSEIEVTGEEHHYLTRVRRHRAGDKVEVRNASGTEYTALVTEISRERALLRIEAQTKSPSPVYPVHLIVAVPKHHLMDDVVRKTSEIGIARIIPVTTARSVVRPKPDQAARWRKIAMESLRQCGRSSPLAVDDVRPFGQALAKIDPMGTHHLLHPAENGVPLWRFDAENAPKPPFVVAIGPEGGFTDDEVVAAEAAGFMPIALPMPILRVETAAITAAVLSVAMLGKATGVPPDR